jgi:hypothetical protein
MPAIQTRPLISKAVSAEKNEVGVGFSATPEEE